MSELCKVRIGEIDRMRFLEARDGREAAAAFAKRTREIYRACIVGHYGVATAKEYRRRLFVAQHQLKKFLES